MSEKTGLIKDSPLTLSLHEVAEAISIPLKRTIIKSTTLVRRPRASRRRLPEVLVIGAQRSGTTSLHHYLTRHPSVDAPLHKEVDYFSLNFQRDVAWYRTHFSLVARKKHATFDATPSYMYDLRCAKRASLLLPNARIIAILRNPVDRAFSHYKLSRALGVEELSFSQALAAEESRLSSEWPRMVANAAYVSFPLRRFAYRTNGLYALQLQEWLKFYREEQILVLFSDEFYRDPRTTLLRIEAFLGLDHWEPQRGFRVHGYPIPRTVRDLRLDDLTRADLTRSFSTPDSDLSSLLQRPLPWRSP